MTKHVLTPIEERFWAKVEPEPNSGCWIWVGGRVGAGYGALSVGRVEEGNVYAHRLAYTLFRGPIPDGLEPDHLCRLRPCTNPAHLELVTRSENNRRGLLGELRGVRALGQV